MKIFNSLTRKIEHFESISPNEVKLYTCGPTVYNFAHIGNLRTYVFEDVLKKTLIYNGYQVKHVMNVTDVGHLQSDSDYGTDKMDIASKRENKSPYEISRFYETHFFDDCAKLNVERPSVVARATEHVAEMIHLVEILEQKEFTYIANGNVYFSVDKFPAYGIMSMIDTSNELRSRVDHDPNKKNQNDFVLWFVNSKYENHILEWDSPWGKGYPGWHLECSAMAMKYLGERVDIHCGGIDHVSIHHTNEIAQSEAALGHQWVNYWMHGEFLVVDNSKMSKSSGQFLTLSVLNQTGVSSLAYRYFCLLSHYRKQLNFNTEAIENAKSAYEKLLRQIKNIPLEDMGLVHADLLQSYKQKFMDYLNDDLSTANALSVLYAVLNDGTLNGKEKRTLIADFDQVLSLDLLKETQEPVKTNAVDEAEINRLIAERNEARKNKNFKRADEIRQFLQSKNIILSDKPGSTEWHIG